MLQRFRRSFFVIVSFIFIAIIVIIVYSYFQYSISKQNAELKIQENEKIAVIEQKPIEFQGEKIVKNQPIYVLLVGIDTSEGEPARTDTIMIVQYRPKDGTMKLASIMRDSYVAIPNHGQNKINAAFFFGGLELLRKTIKQNFDIDLHHYAIVNFDGFVHIVDTIAPKGLEVDIANNMHYENGPINIHFEKGKQRLNGQEVLNYVRFRNDPESDFGRVKRQQEIMKLIKDELMTVRGMAKLPQIIGSIEPYVQTNVTTAKALSYAKDFFIKPVEQFETLTIPVPDGYADKYYPHAGSVLELDMQKNKQALYEFFSITQ